MPTRTYTRVPRKEKVWAYNRNSGSGTAVVAGVSVHQDLLANYKTDAGITMLQGATCMRIVGSLNLGNAADVTAAGLIDVSWGIAWVRNVIATAGSGDAQIPDPEEPGTREVAWIQRGILMGTSTAGSITRCADQGQLFAGINLDITQMRKQPTVDYQLCLITHGTNLGDGTMQLWVNLDCMLALS